MRSYFIFAIVLTVAYLIYYAVIIMQDLYGKRRTGKTEEEVFDLGTLEDEESVAVSESATSNTILKQHQAAILPPTRSRRTKSRRQRRPRKKDWSVSKPRRRKRWRKPRPTCLMASVQMKCTRRCFPGANWKIVRRWPGNQLKTNCSMSIKQKIVCLLILVPYAAFAKSGSVNYSWGADALATMHDFVVTMMLYVLYICYSIASVLVIVSAFQIYIKMNTGEDGIVKSFLSLLGACLFIIGASIVLPAFFGYRI